MNKEKLNISRQGIQNNTLNFELQLQQSEDQCKELHNDYQYLTYEDYIEDNYADYKCINTLAISPNGQLIVYGGDDNKLTVIDLKNKEIVKQIKFSDCIQSCVITQDSAIIYCGDWFGILYAYSINEEYIQIYKNQLYWERGVDIIRLIDNHQVITCSSDLSIIITDTLNNIQLLKLDKFHRDWISYIEYHPNNGLIISCSLDQSIKFFDYKSKKVLIHKYNLHSQVYQIQLIQNNTILFSRSSEELSQWKVNFYHKDLTLIRKFKESESIYRFAFLIKEQMLIKIYNKHLKILDNNYKTIWQHNHNIDGFYTDSNCSQEISMNYILVLGRKQFKVLKRVNKDL